MANTCKTCRHPERKAIDAMIANREPYLKIAEKYGLNHVSVNAHGKNHVLPAIEEAEHLVQEAVIARVASYRDEVNLPLPEKSKYIENKLWADYSELDKALDRMVVMREIVKQQQEQAKLTGAYIKDADNPADLSTLADVVKRYRADVIEQARIFEGTNGKFGAAMPTEAEMRGEIERLCRHQKVDPLKLDAFVTQQELGRVD